MSIGPINDGKTLRPLTDTEESFLSDATLLGRNGKGIPFVIASGNGGVHLDHCSCDGLINSLYTIAVAGIKRSHKKPYFSEQCPSIMTSAFTAGGNTAGIVTAGTLGSCVDYCSGTLAAPMVAAIIALGLEANPDLSYRQIQNLIVLSSRRTEQMHSEFISNDFWWRNGAGRWVSDLFGFGLLDAKRFVDGAKAMKNKTFPELHTCQIPFNVSRSLLINPQTETTFEVCTDARKFTIPETITSLEHVRLRVDIQPVEDDPGFRGKLKIKLTSPYGRPVYMLHFRPLDKDTIFGFGNWTFTSVLHWFEDPQGCWSVNVTNSNSYGSFVLNEMTLELFDEDTDASTDDHTVDDNEDHTDDDTDASTDDDTDALTDTDTDAFTDDDTDAFATDEYTDASTDDDTDALTDTDTDASTDDDTDEYTDASTDDDTDDDEHTDASTDDDTDDHIDASTADDTGASTDDDTYNDTYDHIDASTDDHTDATSTTDDTDVSTDNDTDDHIDASTDDHTDNDTDDHFDVTTADDTGACTDDDPDDDTVDDNDDHADDDTDDDGRKEIHLAIDRLHRD
ncbi:hypothetical protein ACOME3_001108 [Neoechinorhynchus agilis]